jgi:hypothetical protein
MHSLFGDVSVSLSEKLVSPPTGIYPYRAYIETFLRYGPAAKESQLTGVMWYKDTPGQQDKRTTDSKRFTLYLSHIQSHFLNLDFIIGHVYHESKSVPTSSHFNFQIHVVEVRRVEMKMDTVHTDNMNYVQDNMFLGELPKRLVIA